MKVVSFVAVLSLSLLLAVPVWGQNIDMGETYRSLDAQALEVTTHFHHAVATTERSPHGDLTTALHSPGGRLRGTMIVPSTGPITLTSPYLASGKAEIEAPGFAPSSDWANLQVLSIWRDLRGLYQRDGVLPDASQLAWSGSFVRPWQMAPKAAEAAVTHGRELERAAQTVTSVFRTTTGVELLVTSLREPAPAVGGERASKIGRPASKTAHATFTTEVTDPTSGTHVGIMRWFEEARVLTWSFPGLTQGWVDPERQGQAYPFEPDLAWGNVQALGFLQSHAKRASLSSQLALKNLVVKNTEGCDGLHWLDDTIYRECCDDHDRCYEKEGCTASSWWVIGSSWSCIKCNIDVVVCFVTTFFDGPDGGGGGGGGDSCTVSGAEWCPAECFSCTRLAY